MKSTVIIDNSDISNKLPNFYQNEYGFTIYFTVLDELEQVVDLTGKTVTFQVKSISSTTAKVSASCTLDTDPTTGKCTYVVQDGDFDEIGLYEGELNIVETDVSKRVVKLGMFAILDEIDN